VPLVSFPLIPHLMTRETAPLVSSLHNRPYLTADAICHEYFANPDTSRLYYGTDSKGIVAASQGWVGHSLIRNGETVPTLQTERTLLASAFWARADYRSFYLWTLAATASATKADFVWGGTSALKAFKRYGFEATDCLGQDVLITGFGPILRLLATQASWRWRAFHAALYGLALAKHWFSFCWIRTTGYAVAEEEPTEAELTVLMKSVSQANPETYFMTYTRAKLDWLAVTNPFRKREVVTLRRNGVLEGLALVDDRSNGIAFLVDCLMIESTRADLGLLALARFFKRRGRAGLQYWGNRSNAYVGAIRNGLNRLGAVPLRRESAHIVVRKSGIQGDYCPPAAALAMTWMWSPPL
jgi:hypothetical protein